jgi:CRISPR-associated protein Cas2
MGRWLPTIAKWLPTVAKRLHDTIKRLHDTIKRLHDTIKRLHDTIKRLHDTIKRLHDTIKRLHDTIKRLHDTIKRLHDTIKRLHDTIKRLHDTIKRFQTVYLMIAYREKRLPTDIPQLRSAVYHLPPMFILISYDIPDNKRRTKIAKILEDYGDRVQYSVFECEISARHLKQLLKELGAGLNEAEDSLRVYRLCQNCVATIEVHGQGKPPAENPQMYLV